MNSNPTETCYQELQRIYDALNRELFQNQLPGALLTLQREKKTMGYFCPARFGNRTGGTADEIAINPEWFAVLPIIEIIQTIGHEMAHQWQHHFGKPGRGRYHNEQWASKMEAIGLMPSSTGKPGGARTGDSMNDYVMPTGRFLPVAQSLSNDGPIVTWFDRFAPRSLALNSIAAEFDSGSAPASTESINQLDTVIASLVPVIAKPIRNPVAAKAGVRQKYVCAGCQTAVWAKPDLTNLGCNDCELPFIESN
jgi:predicted SprT family Zn-dependent metalloprotease